MLPPRLSLEQLVSPLPLAILHWSGLAGLFVKPTFEKSVVSNALLNVSSRVMQDVASMTVEAAPLSQVELGPTQQLLKVVAIPGSTPSQDAVPAVMPPPFPEAARLRAAA